MTRRTAIFAGTLASCGSVRNNMDDLARRYVQLILGIGHHDPNYVDAYYGPADWKPVKQPVTELFKTASALQLELDGLSKQDPQRLAYLQAQTRSAIGRLKILQGESFSFDREARLLYEADPPRVLVSDLEAALAELEKLVPGAGPLPERYEKFDAKFAIPPDRVDRAFRAAIAEARSRTKKRIPEFPANESFDIEYVKGKSWSAYNWYKGNAHSLIQVNVDLPINVERILHLACHEGYPGHHVYNGLLEARLVKERGWHEFSVYPLYSPQSLIAEGTADFGSSLVIPGAERLSFKRDVLFREAGLDSGLAEIQQNVLQITRHLRHTAIEAARSYLDRGKTAQETVAYLHRYGLQPIPMAERRIKFFDEHRSYIINYSLGEDLVAGKVNRTAGEDESARWKAFLELLSTPQIPANLL